MNKETFIYKLIIKFGLDYDYALSLVISISNRNLLEHLSTHIEEYDTYEKFYNTYF